MAKFKIEEEHTISSPTNTHLRLSPVTPVRCGLLKEHPLNKELFAEESDAYFERLREDVKERGILVALIARRDGTLLAGHNRLRVAKELGFATVPVAYLSENEKDKLTTEQEKAFLIKDNLFRRQFSGEEWIQTYRKLYPDFDEQVMQASRSSLNAAQIAADTGQSKAAVQKQLQKFRREKSDEPKVERVHFGAKELRAAIERAVCELELNHKKEALEILKEVL